MRPPIPEPVEPLPPLDALRFFETAARHQSFLRAAEELGVTAAAVGHRVRTIEHHLGAELFVRRARRVRRVRLNRRGRAYHAAVRRILADLRDATVHHADGRRFRGRLPATDLETVTPFLSHGPELSLPEEYFRPTPARRSDGTASSLNEYYRHVSCVIVDLPPFMTLL